MKSNVKEKKLPESQIETQNNPPQLPIKIEEESVKNQEGLLPLDQISGISNKNSTSNEEKKRHETNFEEFNIDLEENQKQEEANEEKKRSGKTEEGRRGDWGRGRNRILNAPGNVPGNGGNWDQNTINISRPERKKKKTKLAPKSEFNSFLEDFDRPEVRRIYQSFPGNEQMVLNKIPKQEPIMPEKELKSFSFRGSAVSNSRELKNQNLFKKKKREEHFTEINNQSFDQPANPNDTSINIGLPPIPVQGRVQLGHEPSFQMDNSFNIPRNVYPAGSNADFLSNLENSFQKGNESGFHEASFLQETKEPSQGGLVKLNNSVLENLNTSFKDYNRPNVSFHQDKAMNRLDRMDNSFNLSVNKPQVGGLQMGLNDTLNQSGQFNLRQFSRTNLDTSQNYYTGTPKDNFLNVLPAVNEGELAEGKSGAHTSFEEIPQNILSMLDQKPLKGGKDPQEKEPEKFFMDPEKKEASPQMVNAKLQRTKIVEETSEKEEGSPEVGEELKNSDIINYIIKNYNAQCIKNVVNAKCAKYIKKKPDIFEMINSVISKNKKWQKILQVVQKELAKKEGSSDSDNMKSTFSITTEQKKSDQKIVNKININFNTEVKYQGLPWEMAKLLKRKRRRRRRPRKARDTEDGLKKRKTFKKSLKGYSERFSSSNGSDSSERVINCKRVKRDSSAKSEAKMTSFISESKGTGHFPEMFGQKEHAPDSPEEVKEVIVVRKKNKTPDKESVIQKGGQVKRKRGRPKGSKNSKTSSVKSKMLRAIKGGRGRRKRSLKETMKDIILKDGESLGMSDLDSRSGIRSRRSRRKKSDLAKEDEENFSGLRGKTRLIFEILRVSFTEMSINVQTHADFLNSNSEEAKVLRVILRKKFELKDEVVVEKLKMKKEKKRNEEINKFVVKRCMKFLMKRNRDKTMQKEEELLFANFAENRPGMSTLPEGSENRALLGSLQKEDAQVSDTFIFNKEGVSSGALKLKGSLSNHSLTDAKNTNANPSETKEVLLPNNPKNLYSQSDFPNLGELENEVIPESSLKDLSFMPGEFGPKHFFDGQSPFGESIKQDNLFELPKYKKPSENEPKENTKMLAHSKLLSEHQFYKKYFERSSTETGTPLAKYYLPNTKLANEANRKNKGNKQAQSYKTINIKYIKLILHSRYFTRAIRDFLTNTFEFEYRETRIQKLRLLAKSINNPKYIKSVKLPWTMHEIMEAKSTFVSLIDSTEKELNLNSKDPSHMSVKSDIKKKKASPLKIPERRQTRSRTRSRKLSPVLPEDNFQACFANGNKSNKFLGN